MSELQSTIRPHLWREHRLAAQILRSWVREMEDHLPAWTPEAMLVAYTQLRRGCEAVIAATQAAEKDTPGG